jgi:hypothetical protein
VICDSGLEGAIAAGTLAEAKRSPESRGRHGCRGAMRTGLTKKEGKAAVRAGMGWNLRVWDVALLLTLLPDTRISMRVENGKNLDTVFLLAVIDGMRKTAQQGTAHGRGHRAQASG